MVLETAQILSTAHRVIDGMCVEVTYKKLDKLRKKKVWILDDSRNDILYSATHINHPCSIWVRESVENYNWLVDHFFALANEYTYRYGKHHKSAVELGYTLQSPPYGLRDWDWTIPPSCMDESFTVGDDPVENYRSYYKYGKRDLHNWTKRNPPEWIL